VQQDCEKLLSCAAAADRPVLIFKRDMFRLSAISWANMVDERIAY
jgi:hypothetical protein